jgi:hypothetical protein
MDGQQERAPRRPLLLLATRMFVSHNCLYHLTGLIFQDEKLVMRWRTFRTCAIGGSRTTVSAVVARMQR